MSTLQVANLHLESTGNNRIQYTSPNTISIYAGGVLVFTANTSTGGAILGTSANVGNNSNTTFIVAHNLNRNNIFVSIREISSGYFVYPDIKHTDSNNITLEFLTPPTANQYYVSILGV